MPKRHKQISAGVFGAAAIALAVGGVLQPTMSHAEKVWDIGDFDSCTKSAENRFISGQTNSDQFSDEVKFCCIRSGGEWTQAQGCTAPAATFAPKPTPLPSQVATGPGQATSPGARK
ncbi:hypothetical protein A5651_17625 [Mycobacterium sp. 1274761.0]|nr:hypothetical protein A5651_17625 [Mycobacterium sp. 1274761.0]